jgi:hypothetical protein
MRRIMRKIVDGEGDQLGDLSALAEPDVVDTIKAKLPLANECFIAGSSSRIGIGDWIGPM